MYMDTCTHMYMFKYLFKYLQYTHLRIFMHFYINAHTQTYECSVSTFKYSTYTTYKYMHQVKNTSAYVMHQDGHHSVTSNDLV